MKALKKLSCVLLAVLLLMSLSVTAFADGTVSIESQLAGHTFTAYQIFKGTQNDESGNRLASVEWGDDIDSAKFVEALNGLGAPFGECKADEINTVVEALSKATEETLAKKVAEAAYASLKKDASGTSFTDSTVLPNGYYLIKDTTKTLSEGQAYNDVVLQVTEDVTIKYKTDVPESKKKVQDKNDTDGSESGWQDSADWDIGDPVPFQLTGTLPNDFADYGTYKLVFHDVQSDGLTFDPKSVKVTVGGKDATLGTDYTVNTAPGDDCTFEIEFADLKKVDGAANDAEIVVTYTSTLNSEAVVGPGGNPNEMYMEFSNDSHGDTTTNTPKDKVVVFTYQFDANKVEPDPVEGNPDQTKPLEGAAFTLLKKVDGAGNITLNEGTPYEKEYEGVEEVKKYTVEPGKTTFEFKGLDDGEYILVESTVPAGYNKAEDIEFKVEATHEDNSADPQLLTFKATSKDGEDDKVLADESGTITGKISLNVLNQKGLELPETGGIGTTIFYTVGGILVAAALILLITKKRMSKEA